MTHTYARAWIVAALAGAFAFASLANAYVVSPLIFYLTPTGDDARAFVTIENTHDFPLTLELSTTRREVGPDGTEAEQDASGDFVLFPPQLILQPGAKQRVQVAYVGGPIPTSRAYRLVVQQVEVGGGEEDGDLAVGFKYNFRAGVYVVPEGAAFDVAVASIEPADGGYLVTLTNAGNAHAVLTSGPWRARDADGNEVVLDNEALPIKQAPLIAPGSERTAFVPTGALGSLGELASLSVEPTR